MKTPHSHMSNFTHTHTHTIRKMTTLGENTATAQHRTRHHKGHCSHWQFSASEK